MQQQTYAIIMFLLLPAQMITGLFLWKIKSFENYIEFMGGIRVVNSLHVLLCFFFTAFIIGHIYLATLGHTPLAHIKAMFTGYEDMEPEPEAPAPPDSGRAAEEAKKDGGGFAPLTGHA